MASILIVEDDTNFQSLLAKRFENNGWKVTTAPNGQVALDILTGETQIDLIILDLQMPTMDGNTFLSQANMIIPTIVLTNGDQSTFPQEVIACFKKSQVSLDQIETTVKKYLVDLTPQE